MQSMHTFRSSSSTLARYKGQDESQSPNFLLVVPDAQDEKTTPNKIEESNSTQIIVTFLWVTIPKNHGSSSFIPLEITIDLMIFH